MQRIRGNVGIGASIPPPSQDILWKQYELHVNLYRDYLKLILEFNVFYYAVTGAILSFYFSNTANVGVPRYGLLVFPLVMSTGFGAFLLWASSLVRVTRDELNRIAEALHLLVFPEVRVLTVLLVLDGLLLLLIAAGLMIFICDIVHT